MARNSLVRRFRSTQQDVFVSLQKAADLLLGEVDELLKGHDLTTTQYNVLRILRSADSDGGLACNEIGERLITRDPDITRLLDRMEARKLVARARDVRDRRVVTTRITLKGLKMLTALDEPVQQLHEWQMSRLAPEQLHSLLDMLEQLRDRTPVEPRAV